MPSIITAELKYLIVKPSINYEYVGKEESDLIPFERKPYKDLKEFKLSTDQHTKELISSSPFKTPFTHLKLNINIKNANGKESFLNAKPRSYFKKTQEMLRKDNLLIGYHNHIHQSEKINNTKREIASLLSIDPEQRLTKNQSATLASLNNFQRESDVKRESRSIITRINGLKDEMNSLNVLKDAYTPPKESLFKYKKSIIKTNPRPRFDSLSRNRILNTKLIKPIQSMLLSNTASSHSDNISTLKRNEHISSMRNLSHNNKDFFNLLNNHNN